MAAASVASAFPPQLPPLRRARLAQQVVLALLVLFGAVLRVVDRDGVTRRSPDEFTYTDSANLLIDQGTAAGYAALFAAYDPDRPSPARVGYHWLLTTTMRLTGDRTARAGADLSCGASILSLLLLACVGWRLLPASGALAATLLFAVSPAELVMARRCWGESVVELITLGCLAVAIAITLGTRRRWFYLVFLALGVLAITVKETAALGFLLALLWILLVLARRGDWRAAIAFLGSSAAALALALVWAAIRFGGFAQLHWLAILTSKASANSAYGLAYESGSGWLLVPGLGALSAATLVLAAIAAVGALYRAVEVRGHAKSGERWPALLGLLAVCVVLLLLIAVVPQRLNFRYACGVFAPLALLAGAGFSDALRALRRWVPATEARTLRLLLAAGVVFAAAYDWHTFATRWTLPDRVDLSIRMVLESAGRNLPDAPVVAATQSAAIASPAAQLTELSAQFIQRGQNEQGIAAAEKALALDANSAVAWNNIAAANENLQRWDPAIDAAQHALQLQPDFQLARNNLAWSLAQKAKGR